jgi:hypothetical protein
MITSIPIASKLFLTIPTLKQQSKVEIFFQTCQVNRKIKDNVSIFVLINSSGFFKVELKLIENWIET